MMANVKKSKAISIQKSTVEESGIYINPLTDFGFKRIFGTEANKDLLINFLESILDIDGGIKNLRYGNPEKPGRAKTDSKVIFDLYCTTGKGEYIIIEMQRLSQEYYKDRTLYYASFPIQEQGEKRKKWNFELRPVYSINIVNFLLKLPVTRKKSTNKYASFIQLIDRDTHQVFYDKLTFVYMELPRFTKNLDELQNNVERWMYVLKHLSKLNDLPDALRNRIFKKLFEQAKIANMTMEEINTYNNSLKNFRDMYLIEYELKAKNKALAEKNKIIEIKDKVIAEKEKTITEKEKILAEKEKILAEKEKELKELRQRLELPV